MMQNVILTPIPITELVTLISDEVKKHMPSEPKTEVKSTNENEGYYTRKEVCKLFRISLVTLNKHTKSKRLNAHRIGSRVLYKKSEIQKALITIK